MDEVYRVCSQADPKNVHSYVQLEGLEESARNVSWYSIRNVAVHSAFRYYRLQSIRESVETSKSLLADGRLPAEKVRGKV